jgi:hypothetical protein
MRERPKKRIGRPPLPQTTNSVAEIKAVIAELPAYDYRGVYTILKRQALAASLKPPNHKRVYRIMKVYCCSIAMPAASRGDMTSASPSIRRWCSSANRWRSRTPGSDRLVVRTVPPTVIVPRKPRVRKQCVNQRRSLGTA